MMKKLFCAALAAGLLFALSVSAFADHLATVENGSVTYTTAGKLDDNFARLEDAVRDLQPGDDITVVVRLKNENSEASNWYMSNTVLNSLEDTADTSASGSAYTYRLSYVGPTGEETVIFDSDTVGGDDSEGLKEATGALQDYFYLDHLTEGQEANVRLDVALDGETEGNDYFNTLADLEMKFAVEPTAEAPAPTGDSEPGNSPAPGESPAPTATPRPGESVGEVVQTGDELALLPFGIAMAVSGLLFLALAVDSVRQRKREREESTQ